MKKIIKSAELREQLQLELEIIVEFFATENLKMLVVDNKNNLRLFEQKSKNFEQAIKTVKAEKDLYNNLTKLGDLKVKEFLAKQAEEFENEDLLYFLVNVDEYIYIIFFQKNEDNKNHKPKSLNLFEKQFKIMLEDIYIHEITKDTLKKKDKENKVLKKEKYITASALDSIPGNISILDEKGVIVYTNNAWNKFAQANDALPFSVGVGTNYLAVTQNSANKGSQLSAEVVEGIKAILNKEKDHFSVGYPCHSPEKKRWFRMYASPFKGIGSYEVLIIHQDITKEKLAEKNSLAILNNLPASIIKVNQKAEIIYFNQRAKNLFAFEKNSLSQEFHKLNVIEPDLETYLEKINHVLKTEKRLDLTLKVKRNGKIEYYKNLLLPDSLSDTSPNLISVILEKEVKIDKNNKNQKTTNFYLQLFNNFPDSIVLLNTDGKIINANKKFCRTFKYEIKDLKKKKIDNLITPAGEKVKAETLTKSALIGKTISQEVLRVDSYGKEMNFKLFSFPVLLPDNKIGVYAVYKEIK